MRKVAEQGSADSQFELAGLYLNGGVNQNYVEAVKWLRMASEKGHKYAQFTLGSCYYKGYGVTVDQSIAVKWVRRAANQGLCEAQYSMGEYYMLGVGVQKDMVMTYMWLNLAAASTSPSAKSWIEMSKRFRDKLEAKMTTAEIAKAKKLSSEFKPAIEVQNP